jgi:hypothetical protein
VTSDSSEEKVNPLSGSPRHHAGDLWELWDTWGKHPGSVLVITVNATQVSQYGGGRMELGEKYGVMGKGCAREARTRHPELQRWWSGKLSLGGYGGFWHCTPVNPDPDEPHLDRKIGLLVTKRNWWEPSNYGIIAAGLEQLMDWSVDALKAGRDRFVMPLPGAGCGGLAPETVKKLCRKYLDGRFVVCTK